MLQGQKLLENGVEVALYPDIVLCITQETNGSYSHQGILRVDTGGPGLNKYNAPCTLKVVKNDDPNYHEVFYWTVNPVKTRDHGITHLTFSFMHNADVSDLPVGKIIPQGEYVYKEGGQGPNGPTQYASHIDMGVALGHTTTKIKRSTGKWDLQGAVGPETVLFINDTQVVQTLGMNFSVYVPPVPATMVDVTDLLFKPKVDMKIRELPSTSFKSLGVVLAGTELVVAQRSSDKADGYEWVKINYNGIIGYCAVLDPTTVFAKPIVIPEPIVVPEPEPEPIVIPEPEPKPDPIIPEPVVPEPVLTIWIKIFAQIIQFILSLFNGAK